MIRVLFRIHLLGNVLFRGDDVYIVGYFHSRCLWIILREAFVKFRVEARPRQV